MIHVRELTPDDADAVAAMELKFHDPSVTDSADEHRRRLVDAAAENVNLCLGAFERERLVGYLLCYGFEPTAFAEERGSAIYIEDVVADPRYQTVVARLIRRFARDVNLYFPGRPLEAHSVEDVLDIWRKHYPWFRRLGFIVRRCTGTGETIAGQARYALRWESIGRTHADQLDQILEQLPTRSLDLDGRPYVLKLVRRESDWDGLERLWDELLLATPEHTVFQSYAYQRLWWKHFGGDSDLLIVLLIRDGIVVGIAPLRTVVVKHYGRYRRMLTFIGSRWEVDRPQFLFPRDSAELIRVLVRYLTKRASRWEICDFYEQPTGSETEQTLAQAFRAAGCLVGRSRDSDCPYIAIAGTWREFMAGKTQKFRKNLKASARRLQESGELEYRTYTTLPDITEKLAVYREIEQRSWKDAGGVGVTLDAGGLAFYKEAADVFGAAGGFVIRVLSAGGRAVAGTFGLVFDGVYYSLQIAHDREFDRCSPGTYLESLEIEECFGSGHREYEFLGGFLSNKSRWTSTYRHTTELHVYRRTPYLTALYVLLFRIKPRVKDLIRPFMKSWARRPPP
jgi:CelD/BcsL family acetyltransferase involved in cellulose biosynthesis